MKIIYLSGIILTIYYIYKKYLKKFYIWGKYNSNSNILDNKTLTFMLENDIQVRKDPFHVTPIYDINRITEFLNDHFSTEQFFIDKQIEWVLGSPHTQIDSISHINRTKWNIGLKKFNKLIGLMCIRPIITNMNNKLMKTFWCDYVCVHKDFRKRGIGIEMELRGLYEIAKSNFDNMLYIVDNKKVFHDHLCEIKYYMCNIKKHSYVKKNDIHAMMPSDIDNSYNLYRQLITDKKIYQLFSKQEFVYYFKPDKDYIYSFVSDKTICIVSLFYFKYGKYLCNIPSISMFLTHGNVKKELLKIFSLLKKLKFNNVIINNTIDLPKLKHMKYEGNSYLYGFNFFDKIDPTEFGIPLF
tara:strand:+ start:739 stop:1800 length:1062 start_codon:yes stop_codon:yes gene_type:complete